MTMSYAQTDQITNFTFKFILKYSKLKLVYDNYDNSMKLQIKQCRLFVFTCE